MTKVGTKVLKCILKGETFRGDDYYIGAKKINVSFKDVSNTVDIVRKVIDYVCKMNNDMNSFEKWRTKGIIKDSYDGLYRGIYVISLYVEEGKLHWKLIPVIKSSNVRTFKSTEVLEAIAIIQEECSKKLLVINELNDESIYLRGKQIAVIDVANSEHLEVIVDAIKKINPYEHTVKSWFYNQDGNFTSNVIRDAYKTITKQARPNPNGSLNDSIEIIKSLNGDVRWNMYSSSRAPSTPVISSFEIKEVVDYEIAKHKLTKKANKEQEKTNVKKEEVKPMSKFVKVFYKGKAGTKALNTVAESTEGVSHVGANVKGIVHQFAKGANDTRPFVATLLIDELDRVIASLLEFPARKHYNAAIKANDIIAIDVFREIIDIQKETIKVKKLEEKNQLGTYATLAPKKAVLFYKAEALAARKKKPKFDWINEYLTHENINNQVPTTLFESKYIKIYIKDGFVVLHEVDRRTGEMTTYKAIINYSTATNSFSLLATASTTLV